MDILPRVEEVRAWVQKVHGSGMTVGLVPTMGALHAGHLELMQVAARACDRVMISIFVNPTQFGPGEDYERYPRDLEHDADLAATAGVHAVFAPAVGEMYPPGYATYVQVEGITDKLCGRSRPGHFRGVATVVTKLLTIVRPDKAFFGQKDYQQALVVRRLVTDLHLGAEIVIVPTVREADGLAMSSRNSYLHPAERQQALGLYQALQAGREAIGRGERRVDAVEAKMRKVMEQAGVQVDYAEVCRAADLENPAEIAGSILLAVAGWVGATRLIDNLLLEVE